MGRQSALSRGVITWKLFHLLAAADSSFGKPNLLTDGHSD